MTQLQFEKIAEKIKARRESMEISYQKLSDLTGLSKSTLQRYETGGIKNIPIEKLRLITDALKISLPELINSENVIEDKEKVKTAARNEKMIRKFDKLSESKKKIVEDLINSYFDEDMEDEE